MCSDWEAAAEPARQAGARVVHLRTGVVLSPHGGLLGRLRPIVRMGVGGRLGSGRQFVAWISLADMVAATAFLINSDLDGPFNLTAPNPVRNSELVGGLARLLKRPAVIPVPKFALRLAVGDRKQVARHATTPNAVWATSSASCCTTRRTLPP